jgi:hypothetical protein
MVHMYMLVLLNFHLMSNNQYFYVKIPLTYTPLLGFYNVTHDIFPSLFVCSQWMTRITLTCIATDPESQSANSISRRKVR